MDCDPGPEPARSKLQGLIVRGYTHPHSTHMLFRFPGRAAAAAFVKALLPRLQSGADWGAAKPALMLNIGLTFAGVKIATALGSDLNRFPMVFQKGPTSKWSQQTLYDLGDSAPENWWAKNFAPGELHCIVHAYALDETAEKEIVAFIADAATSAGVEELFGTADKSRFTQAQFKDDLIQFGYRDGISNPSLQWPTSGKPFDAGTLDNFVLGYPACTPFSPGPAGDNAAARFAKDGCYNAFRVISQDVAGFETFLDEAAKGVVTTLGMPAAEAREWIAAKIMGRWRNGSPLVLSPDAPDDATRDVKAFVYADDKAGLRCPISAHIRVSNPRDQSVFPANFPAPRLIRRGMPYGPPGLEPGADRGLIGLFLCGALDRQFETVYAWMNQNTFSDVFSPKFNTQDAVVGARARVGVDTQFVAQTAKGEIRCTMPQFLTTRGTAYCLMPSIASIEAIAEQRV
ncbi:MAG TPA: hypothetical protein VJZ76_17460 [Thermoanaerobaculia bacterium]|nr:hypothetical protein [Thermoanaerobaculia bacterium]